MTKKLKTDFRFCITFTIGVMIFLGFLGFGYPWNIPELPNRFIWELVLFSFVIGSMILSSNYKYSKKNEYFDSIRFGSTFILAGGFMLLGSGLLTLSKIHRAGANDLELRMFIMWTGLAITGFGPFFLSYLLADLFWVFGRRVFNLRK